MGDGTPSAAIFSTVPLKFMIFPATALSRKIVAIISRASSDSSPRNAFMASLRWRGDGMSRPCQKPSTDRGPWRRGMKTVTATFCLETPAFGRGRVAFGDR